MHKVLSVLKKYSRSLTVRIIVIMILLVIPLNIWGIVTASEMRKYIYADNRDNLYSIGQLTMKDLDSRMRSVDFYLFNTLPESSIYFSVVRKQAGDEQFYHMAYNLHRDLYNRASTNNDADVYFFYSVDTDYCGIAANSERTDILEKYGYDAADHKVTIEELEEMFAKVKEGEGSSYYPVAGAGSFQCLDGRYDLVGGSTYTGAIMLDDDTDNVVNMYESEAYKNYAYRMYDWAQKGFISPDAATTQDSAPTLLATGNYFGAFVYLGEGTRSSYGGNGAIELTALEIQPGYTTTSDLMSVIFGIASTCEQPEKAIAFLNELYTNPELSRILQFGIEDQHYVMVDENEKGWKQVAFPEGLDMNSSGYYVALGVWEAGGTTVWSSEKGYAQLEERAVRKNYEKSPAFGYVFNSSEFSTELTALSAVYNEYNKIIDSGAINPDQELTAFIDALKAADIEKVIEENNAQYQQWKAGN